MVFCRTRGILFFLFIASFYSIAPGTAAESVTFNFHEADIQSVIKSVAKITGKTFVVDPKVKGNVTIVSSQPMDAKAAYGVFLSILQVHDYAAVEAGSVVKIIPFAQAKQDLVAENAEAVAGQPEDRIVTQVYKLEYVQADKLVAVLRPLVTQQSYLAANKESNSIIISDRAGNIARLLRIIRRVDRDSAGDIDVVRLEHADAREVASVIESLEMKSGLVSAEQLRMAADGRTNSILLSGDGQHLLRAKALIAHLDTPVEKQGSTQVVFLRHAKAKELVPILGGLELPDGGRPGAGVQPAGARQRPDVLIQADESTNALIITAPPAAMQSLQAVVRQLDIRRVQLMIEAVIAEVSTDKGAELGVQWRSTDTVNGGGSGVIGGTNFNATGLGINQANANNLAAIGNLNGLNLGFFNGTTTILGTEFINLGALVKALATDVNTNILSTPSLVTMDNEEAEIVVGQNVPFVTGSFSSIGTGTSAVNPFQTIERQDVGLKLRVKPQINEGGVIRLDIRQEVCSVVPTSSTVLIAQGPTTNTRSITTSVMVEDGRILVLGGLIQDDVQESVHKVPLLGDIPLLGALFRFTSSSHEKRNLMVFLRPIIMRDSQVSSKITFDKYDHIRNRQLERDQRGIALLPGPQPVLPGFEEYQEPLATWPVEESLNQTDPTDQSDGTK
jgi:general secretion pathway protein D